ncbi:MAG: SAM-dependent methyltransferase [Thermogemmatispora sp.]|uniref:SAM-dependent methyltransferase n=1 Tax=Thermogemmatispora sp. TaxID=1968838 RepID=UPI0019DB0DEF|nr:SAM-dependent methyltransferase [Thermogemmatispora sp.]MBE3565097.1 SAM-dependent methyltransferase [Thermogemmatispora sp.]
MSETAYSSTPKELIGPSAFMTAAVRAFESQRPDRLFNDPWAAVLATEEGERRRLLIKDHGAPIIVRTRFFDDCLDQLVHEEDIKQIVLPAAGLDTRAFRMEWPEGTRFFELDQPMVLEYKEEVLQRHGARPLCDRRSLAVDLAASEWPDALLQAGYDPSLPAIWLVEGLLFYLSEEQIRNFLSQVSNLAAPGSWLGFDSVHSAMLKSPLLEVRTKLVASLGSPWLGAIDDPVSLLGSYGWQATVVYSVYKALEYDRPVFPFIPKEELTPELLNLYHLFVTARKEGTRTGE